MLYKKNSKTIFIWKKISMLVSVYSKNKHFSLKFQNPKTFCHSSVPWPQFHRPLVKDQNTLILQKLVVYAAFLCHKDELFHRSHIYAFNKDIQLCVVIFYVVFWQIVFNQQELIVVTSCKYFKCFESKQSTCCASGIV